MKYQLEVVLTKRDPQALVREYSHVETVDSLDVATSTADALISRLAVFDGEYRRDQRLITRHLDKVSDMAVVYWSTVSGTIVGYANINEIR